MQASHWEEVAVYAATLHLPTDAVYLARLDPAKVDALNAATLSRLRSGHHEPGSLYVLGDATMLAAARQGFDPARDLLEKFDGVWVLAPGWHAPGGQASATLRMHR
jgi:calcineurin-like phosphoesterase family protein